MGSKRSPDEDMEMRLVEALRAMAEEETAAGHPGAEELAAYSDGGLPADREDQVQEHLAFCRECAARMADVAQLAASEEPRFDAGTGSLWRPEPDRSVSSVEPEGRWSAHRWLIPLAAALLLAVLGLSAWVYELRSTLERLSRPQLNTPVAVLMPGAFLREAEEQWTVIDPPAGVEAVTLVLSLQESARFEEYSLEIATEDQVRWRGGGLERNVEGSFSVSLPRAWLSPGRLHLRLFGQQNGEKHLLATYPLEIRDPGGGSP
jgi:hypothetical protein